jgi:hypothetical protein
MPGKVPDTLVEGQTYVFTVWPHGTYKATTTTATGAAATTPMQSYTGSHDVAAQGQ